MKTIHRRKQWDLYAALFCGLVVGKAMTWAQPPEPESSPPKPVEQISPEELNQLIGGPTLVTLQFEDASAQEVFDALSQQAARAGISLSVTNELFLAERKESVTINLVNRPIWEAISEVTPQMGLRVQGGSDRPDVISLGKYGMFLQGPAVSTYPCIIIVDGLRGTRTLYLNSRPPEGKLDIMFQVLIEPKVRINPRSIHFNLSEAINEKGESLLPDGNKLVNNHYMYGRSSPGLQVENLELPTPGDGRITRLQGDLRFLVQTKSDIWTVPDILNVRNAVKTIVTPRGTERYEVVEAFEKDDENSIISIKITRQHPWLPHHDPQEFAGKTFYPFDYNLSALVRVVDAQGQQLPNYRRELGDNNRELTADFEVTRLAEDPRGKPATLIWEIPVEYREVVIPFEFKDLPLP